MTLIQDVQKLIDLKHRSWIVNLTKDELELKKAIEEKIEHISNFVEFLKK